MQKFSQRELVGLSWYDAGARSFYGTEPLRSLQDLQGKTIRVQDSQIVKGTEQLIGDVTTWLMVLAPVVAGLLIIYFCIRRGMADEMDQKKWNNRIVVAVVSCIGAVLGSATLNLILGYYQ